MCLHKRLASSEEVGGQALEYKPVGVAERSGGMDCEEGGWRTWTGGCMGWGRMLSRVQTMGLDTLGESMR